MRFLSNWFKISTREDDMQNYEENKKSITKLNGIFRQNGQRNRNDDKRNWDAFFLTSFFSWQLENVLSFFAPSESDWIPLTRIVSLSLLLIGLTQESSLFLLSGFSLLFIL